MSVISHWDADGVGCVALLYRAKENYKISTYFTSPTLLRQSLCKLCGKKESKELYIFDLSGDEKTIRIASLWEKTLWIDHHDWEPEEKYKNVEIVLKKYPSATAVVAEYFGIDDKKFVDIINQIDTNSVKDEKAEFLRDYISSVKWRYFSNQRIFLGKMRNLARILGVEGVEKLEMDEKIVEETEDYRKWVKNEIETQIERVKTEEIEGLNVALLEQTKYVPIHLLSKRLEEHPKAPFDLIIVVGWGIEGNDIKTRIEFRTHTNREVLKIAKHLGGGGHSVAAGASIKKYLLGEEVMEIIKKFLKENSI